MALQRLASNSRFGGRLLLAAISTAAVAVSVVFGFVNAPQVRAQSSQAAEAPLPSFEVASIKQDHSQDDSDSKTRLFQFPSPGRFHTVNMPVKMMIQFAYNIDPSQISGGPSWVSRQGYVIDAKVDDSLVPDLQKLSGLQRRIQMRLMVRSLLTDRFKLILRSGTKEMPIYALLVDKGGPKLKPTTYTTPDPNGPPPSPQERGGLGITPGKIRGVNQLISGLAETLALLPELAGRPVRDQTGIKGNYDFEVEFAQEELSQNLPARVGDPSTSNDSSKPSIFTALQDQLGHKLETTKGPVETYTIDHVEMPSEN